MYVPAVLVLGVIAPVDALIVNPYDVDQVAAELKKGLEMSSKEKARRTAEMVETMEERNIYAWAEEFVRESMTAARENRR